MIYDRLENISGYLGCHRNLDTAIRFILENDLSTLQNGRTQIDGDNVFLNIMDAQAAPEEERGYEFHKRYMDIQIDLEGTEIIQIGGRDDLQITEYREDADFGTCVCSTRVSCVMGPGSFLVCMAKEPHRPGIAAGGDRKLRKAVFKIKQ